LGRLFVDLGMSPLANSYLATADLNRMEPHYPLRAFVCEQCWLVQLEDFESPEHIFTDYAYFSSYSTAWLDHARRYVDMAVGRFGLGPDSWVVEIASNDGYLLQYLTARNIPVLGIEPAVNVAQVAIEKGIPTLTRFFGEALAIELRAAGRRADLIVGNNVFAHVPDPNDFLRGLKVLLAPHGIVTLEFPHLLRLYEDAQFDTIYHEHLSYYSLLALEPLFRAHGLPIFDVEHLPTHGGSVRVYARHSEDESKPITARVDDCVRTERAAGLADPATYTRFGERAAQVKCALLTFLIEARRAGKTVVGYGAPAKGNTLLNYCGVRRDLLSFTVDASPHKQGRHLPGTHIPIYAPGRLLAARPDYVLILPWNLKDEIIASMAEVRTWGGRFVVPIPDLRVL
jgi:SAM-dependent methyltransferase